MLYEAKNVGLWKTCWDSAGAYGIQKVDAGFVEQHNKLCDFGGNKRDELRVEEKIWSFRKETAEEMTKKCFMNA